MNIRLATPADAPALLQIYAQSIDTPITFECSLPSEQEFAQRVLDIGKQYPYLVCQEKGRIVGYAYAHRQMEREAYQWNAELSVYVDRGATSRGLGTKLYRALMEILACQGVKTVYGGVTVPNEKSEGLHQSLGFVRLGTYRNTGYKCGRWHDVAWFEKQIGPYDPNPKPIVSISHLPKEALDEILHRFSDADGQ